MRMLETEEDFHNVIFVDESSMQLETIGKRHYRRKHSPKIHVWGGISKRGPTSHFHLDYDCYSVYMYCDFKSRITTIHPFLPSGYYLQ